MPLWKRPIKSGKSGGRSGRAGIGRRCSHRRKKGSVALGPREKRRMAQLAVCLALFLVVFIGKGVFPGKLAEVRETVLSAIQADTDFKATFASLGRSISEGEPILDTLGDLWVEVFGGEAVTVPDGEGQVSHAPVPRPGRHFSAASPHVRMR